MQPHFRIFLAILLAASPAVRAATATSHAAPASAPALAKRPNIIFILCDDLGYGEVGVFYQNQRAAMKDRSVPFFTTPQIDTLARVAVTSCLRGSRPWAHRHQPE